tara:strand:- start:120 stop:1244 length:1125 start_codon:yes stop_codon:yes gene_type:complete
MSRAREIADLGSPAASGLSDRNLLINSDMQVAQHGASKAMAHDGNTSVYVVDRFTMAFGGTHEQLDGTYAQVADHPLSANGKSLKWTTGTAESSYDADEYLYAAQIIEAQNLQRINNGNSNAVPITLSFYVKSSITGTFAVGIYKEDSTARIFNKTYAISSANTWEKKTITFAGDASGGGIVNDNGRGFYINWHLAAGSNAVGGGSNGAWKNYGGLSDWADGQATNAIATTASATWQLAQCQLEIGEVATPFEHEDIGTTLRKCQRYLYRLETESTSGAFVNLTGWSADATYGPILYPVEMRSAPALSYGAAVNDFLILSAGTNPVPTAILSNGSSKRMMELSIWSTGNVVAGRSYWSRISDVTNGFIQWDAEL